MENLEITCISDSEDLRIYINSNLHIYFKKDIFIGLQSWYENQNSCKIEFYFKDSNLNFYVAYNSFEKWSKVLELLNINI